MDYIQLMRIAHDVECPVCGTKASFQLTGEKSHSTSTCGHREIDDLVEEREHSVIVNHTHPDTGEDI